MVSKEGIVPENLLFLSVDTADCTISIGNECIAVNLGYFTDISLFQTARLSLFGKFKKISIFGFGIMIIESLTVDSYPESILYSSKNVWAYILLVLPISPRLASAMMKWFG